jgi:serine/threonine-protein kinase
MWIFDMTTRTFAPTAPEGDGIWPVWSIDGTSLTFGQDLPAVRLASMRLDGTATETLIGENGVPGAWSPDGSTLIFTRLLPSSGWEMREWSRAGGDRRLLPPSPTPALERYPTLAPNGRWLAYASNDSGRDQVYVRAYPGNTQRYQVSTDGGWAPAFSRDGRELFFMTGENANSQLMTVGFDTTTGTVSGPPRVLLKGPYMICSPMRCYDPAPDGRHFVMVKGPPPGTDDPVNTQIAVVLNWFDELKRLAPANAKP